MTFEKAFALRHKVLCRLDSAAAMRTITPAQYYRRLHTANMWCLKRINNRS